MRRKPTRARSASKPTLPCAATSSAAPPCPIPYNVRNYFVGQKKGRRIALRPVKLQHFPSSSDLHQILEYCVEATEHRDLVDLLGDLLQSLQLLQAQRGRVVFHHPRSVQQGTGRRSFLTTADHVRQRGLLGLHHLRQDHLHFTRQDDVLHADRVDLEAEAFD